MEITSEIYQIGGEGLTGIQDAAIYLCHFGKHAAIVDAGCGGNTDRLVNNIRSCGSDPGAVDYLFLTHCHFDHTGGAAALRQILNCEIVIHEKDAAALETGDSLRTAANWYGCVMQPLDVQRKFSGSGVEIQLGDRMVSAIHTPGHTPGSVVYVVESDGLRVLFGQDVHGPLHGDFGSNATDYRESLLRMIDLEADILCEGHFGVIRGKKEVKRFIQSYL